MVRISTNETTPYRFSKSGSKKRVKDVRKVWLETLFVSGNSGLAAHFYHTLTKFHRFYKFSPEKRKEVFNSRLLLKLGK